MPIPQFLFNITLPSTTKNWQRGLEIFSQEVIYNKITSELTYINQKDE